jgi:hypothetical protein
MESIAGRLMIVVSAGVLFVAFPGEYGNHSLLPGFIGGVGLPFGLVFAAIQCAVAVHFRKAKVLWLVAGLFVVGALLGTFGRAIDVDGFCAEHHISYAAYIVCGGACASGLGFGIAIVRGWVYDD